MKLSTRRFIEDFYHENFHKLYIYAFSILHQAADAETAVHEAFAAACRKPEEFMNSASPIKWLKRATRYQALHILSDRKRTAALFISLEALGPKTEPSALDGSRSELIEFCLSVVSEDEFAFFLRIAEGASTFPEEAQTQGIKLSLCYKRFERIRQKLQQALVEYDKNKP